MSTRTIVLATTNKGKIRELSEALTGLDVSVLGLDAFPDLPEIAETGATFEENALQKAKTVAFATGMIAVADDSGLEVKVLQGAPGVRSARYSDDITAIPGNNRDERNVNKLLAVLGGAPLRDREARFVCVIAACTPEGRSISARGEWDGTITFEPKGTNGFGYDPIFFDTSTGKTAAELNMEEKMQRSHRAKALAIFLEKWPGFTAGTVGMFI